MEHDGINPDIIKATQLSLGKHLKRPPLTDKLLKKPPFRFLHDIVTSVLKTTDFFKGLFNEDELTSDKVKDRESKILFLNKVIFIIANTTGKAITAKPTKIIAGQDPEKTNELLQVLAFALDNKFSSDEAVSLYKESTKTKTSNENKSAIVTKPANKVTEPKKLTSKGSERLTKNDNKNTGSVKTKQRQNIVKKESPPKKSSTVSSVRNKDVNKEKQNLQKDTLENSSPNSYKEKSLKKVEDIDVNINIQNQAPQASLPISNELNSETAADESKLLNDVIYIKETCDKSDENPIQDLNIEYSENFEQKKDQTEASVGNNLLNNKIEQSTDQQDQKSQPGDEVGKGDESSKQNGQEKIILHDDYSQPLAKITNINNENRPQSVRPSSSRPSAPRFKEKHETLTSSGENIALGKVNIIAENTNEDEEHDSIVIIAQPEEIIELQNSSSDQLPSSHQHGHLVQQILDSQKEFSDVTGKTNIEWQYGGQKPKDMVNQEIEQLRFNIQALSRVANPLGKLLDHIQEDVEVMRQELQQWTVGYEDTTKQLLKQKTANEESLLPLHFKIKQLKVEIEEKRDKTNDLKIIINKNNNRIEKLLTSGNMH